MRSFIVSRLSSESRKSEKNYFFSSLKHRQNDRSLNQSYLRRKDKLWIEFDNHCHAFVFVLVSIRSISECRFTLLTLSTAKVITSSIESISSISIFSVLERHLELRYRLDFTDSLNLLIMRCMKNVIDSQQILKSRSYKKTMNDSSREEWIKIIKNENIFFLINEIWTLINSFKDRRVLRDKWVYKIKKERHDEILRYKTRWVMREFEQIERLDYTKTFVSIIKLMNCKTMYVIIVVNDWKIEQMNVKTTFLYDKILEDVYVVQLTNFEQSVNQNCKLNKALYDLKQSSRIWFETLIKFLFFLSYVSLNVVFNVFMKNDIMIAIM
jgi:hypothetical protein